MTNDFNVERPFNWVTVENQNIDAIGFKIVDGEFTGSIVTVGKISFSEDDPNDNCRMNFEYEVHSEPIVEDRKEIFEKALGDMLLYILVESMKHNKLGEFIGEPDASA